MRKPSAKTAAKSNTALSPVTTDNEVVLSVGSNIDRMMQAEIDNAKQVAIRAVSDIDNSKRNEGTAVQRMSYAVAHVHHGLTHMTHKLDVPELTSVLDAKDGQANMRAIANALRGHLLPERKERGAGPNQLSDHDYADQETKMRARNTCLTRGITLAASMIRAGIITFTEDGSVMDTSAFDVDSGWWSVKFKLLLPIGVHGIPTIDPETKAVVPADDSRTIALDGKGYGALKPSERTGAAPSFVKVNASVDGWLRVNGAARRRETPVTPETAVMLSQVQPELLSKKVGIDKLIRALAIAIDPANKDRPAAPSFQDDGLWEVVEQLPHRLRLMREEATKAWDEMQAKDKADRKAA